MVARAGTILVATANPGKLAEFQAQLGSDFELRSLADFGIELPPEVGATFQEIARVKAAYAARASGLIALGDDSGLEIDALGGQPGIYSARFAGESVSDTRNRAKVLNLLSDVSPERRTARFVCALALVHPKGPILECQGTLEGAIAFNERGSFGFGYDSVFALPNGQTLAELPPARKNQISHRHNAVRVLRQLIDEDREQWIQ